MSTPLKGLGNCYDRELLAWFGAERGAEAERSPMPTALLSRTDASEVCAGFVIGLSFDFRVLQHPAGVYLGMVNGAWLVAADQPRARSKQVVRAPRLRRGRYSWANFWRLRPQQRAAAATALPYVLESSARMDRQC